MGTRLLALGLDPRSDDPALWNLSRPADVLAIHQRDVAAGAGAILTNTFGANRFWLERFGREAMVDSVNRSAVALARRGRRAGSVCDRRHRPDSRARRGSRGRAGVDSGRCAVSTPCILETFRFPDAERVLREIRRSLAVPVPVAGQPVGMARPSCFRPLAACGMPGRT